MVDAAKGFGECGFVFESTLGPFVRDALEVGEMLPRTNKQAQSTADCESWHQRAGDKTAGTGYEAKRSHAFTIGKVAYRFMRRSRSALILSVCSRRNRPARKSRRVSLVISISAASIATLLARDGGKMSWHPD